MGIILLDKHFEPELMYKMAYRCVTSTPAVVAALAELAGTLPKQERLIRWQTFGPPGDGQGPWFETPEEAAGFIEEESRPPEGAEDEPVDFTAEELAQVREVGQRIERDGWGIECITIDPSEAENEWDGW